MDKITIELTQQELEVIYSGLLELQGKVCFPVIMNIEKQVNSKKDVEQ
jgi:hypothetical protein